MLQIFNLLFSFYSKVFLMRNILMTPWPSVDCFPIMLKMMQSTFEGYGLISWLKTRGEIGEKAHNPTLIFLMAILLIWKKALLLLVSNLICLSKGEHAPTSHLQVWYGSYRILKILTHPTAYPFTLWDNFTLTR